MLKPEYLQSVPAPMVSLYEQVEADIIADMAERIAAMDYYIPATEWQMKKLEEMGMTRTAVVKRLSQTTGISEKKLKSIMKSTGNATLKSDREVYKRAGLTPGPLAASENLQRVIESGYQKTLKTFKNLTGTTANTATKQFENALDRAWLQINSGAFSPQEAIKNSIQSLTEKGLEAIEYPSGHVDHLDVAVRRAVVTGVNQTSAGLQIELAKELGADLVETTAHGGARPSHAEWQGKVFSLSGESKKYPSLAEGTGYGTVTGLCGANCRHSFFPYFEGSGKAYSDAELEDYKAEKYEYNGHRMTEYQATQKQRKIERYLRRWKREEKAMKAAGLPAEKAHAKVRKWNDIQEEFLEQTGLKRQYDREWVPNPKQSNQSQTAKQGLKTSNDGDTIKPKEMLRKKATAKTQFKPIGKSRLEALTVSAKKKGANIVIANDTWEDRLNDMNASAACVGDTLIFRKNACLSDVLEETYHFEQNIAKMNDGEEAGLRRILNEIDAQNYLIKNAKKYKIPRNETEHTKKLLEKYRAELEVYTKGAK